MKKWKIIGQEGLCDDWGYCEPYTAAEIIRRRMIKDPKMTEEEIEKIAQNYNCYVKWEK